MSLRRAHMVCVASLRQSRRSGSTSRNTLVFDGTSRFARHIRRNRRFADARINLTVHLKAKTRIVLVHRARERSGHCLADLGVAQLTSGKIRGGDRDFDGSFVGNFVEVFQFNRTLVLDVR